MYADDDEAEDDDDYYYYFRFSYSMSHCQWKPWSRLSVFHGYFSSFLLNTVVGPMWVNKAEGKKCLSGMDASIREQLFTK